MLFRKYRIEIMEEKVEKKFKKLCIQSRYLVGKSTNDILFDLRSAGILLERMLTKGKFIEKDYYLILKDLYKCKTLDEFTNIIRELSKEIDVTEEDKKEINSKLEFLKQKYTSQTGIDMGGDGEEATDDEEAQG